MYPVAVKPSIVLEQPLVLVRVMALEVTKRREGRKRRRKRSMDRNTANKIDKERQGLLVDAKLL